MSFFDNLNYNDTAEVNVITEIYSFYFITFYFISFHYFARVQSRTEFLLLKGIILTNYCEITRKLK